MCNFFCIANVKSGSNIFSVPLSVYKDLKNLVYIYKIVHYGNEFIDEEN